jgi:hypothetical protein
VKANCRDSRSLVFIADILAALPDTKRGYVGSLGRVSSFSAFSVARAAKSLDWFD